MNNESIKLEKVKKSCNISKIICQVFAVLLAVSVAVMIIIPIAFGITGYDKIDKEISTNIENGNLTFNVSEFELNGIFNIDLGLEEMADEGQYAAVITAVCILAAVILATLDVLFWMLVKVFKLIAKSETPFTQAILKRLKAVFILISIFLALINGIGAGIITACIGWSIYTIFDYGFVIQQEIDETL